ncbi:iron-siderophore ABC transporter substrate-binding protein [Thalassospira xianhensis]|uniref:Ferrichrome ABC transporter substrate-binding protein n=1 Tax=Thalassospira xianhensis MCCC 1A02616 TaxID=1177929 RepID=A0A367UCY4_9PROT|nr:iron-siderophore ABC transporter substrate-binding protein [Thalassospira xianhensis]RCK04912.1 ferrichrome ABC transporter substrate-binding protein [Thalassospira xianhensis MCCC 1A02616]
MRNRLIASIACSCVIATGILAPTIAPSIALAETYTHEMGTVNFATPPNRIAVSNWSLTETVLALGIDPVAIPEADGYREWVVEPALPAEFVDLGTRMAPNFEALRDSRPEVILISSDVAMAYDKLSAFAPTMVYSIYNTDQPALDKAEDLMRNVGQLTGRSDKAEEIIASANQRIATAADRIRKAVGDDAKFAVVRILDDAHFRIHGTTSLFGSTLARMGFANTWTGPVNGWGFSNGEIGDLAKLGPAHFAYIEPTPAAVKTKLFGSPVWKALPFNRQNTVYEVPTSWTFGGLLSAVRFAEQLADAITDAHGS